MYLTLQPAGWMSCRTVHLEGNAEFTPWPQHELMFRASLLESKATLSAGCRARVPILLLGALALPSVCD